jgi:CBS domain-containing protein
MTTVSQVMTRGVRTLSPTDTVTVAAQLMDELNVGVIPVCEGDTLIGMVTDRDIVVRGVARSLGGGAQLTDVMSGHVRCATEGQQIEEVLAMMAEAQIRRMPVVGDDQKLVGIVSIGDIAAKDRNDDAELVESLGDISSPAEPDRKT